MKVTIKTVFAICCLALCLTICLTACGNKCEHTYFGDCDEDCDKCGELREATAEHNYYGDCDNSCHSCGKEREATAEHSWKPATCTAAEACEGCGAVKGNPVEHSYTATAYDEHYHYQVCSMCQKPDGESKVKHVLNDEYTCECGVKYTVVKDGEIETNATVELYNSDELQIKQIFYEQGKVTHYFENYYNENGDVMREETYVGDGELLDYCLYEYNENGVLIKEIFYDYDGYLFAYTLYHYDENGILTKKESFENDGTLTFYHLYEYDENGNLSKDEEYNADGTLYDVEAYEYDENGNLIKKKYDGYDEDGLLHYSELTEYNEHGDCIKEEYAYPDGGVDSYEYDEDGKVIKEAHIYLDGNEYAEYIVEYEYDENGNCAKESYKNSTGYESVTEYEYNEYGNMIKATFVNCEDYESVTEYENDENGNCVKESFKDSYGTEYIIEYEYDEDGNEIKKTQRFYDSEGNLIDIITEENEHDFSTDWKSDERGHWHGCQNEGCNEADEIIEHKDENTDNKCDICHYEFGYLYDADTESYTVYTQNGLESVLALGGNIVLNNDIELTHYLTVLNDVTLDLNGKAITIADSFNSGCLISVENGTLTVTDSQGEGKIEANTDQVINVYFRGALVVNGGRIISEGYTLYIDGAVTVNGGTVSYLFGGGNYGEISVTITGGTILGINLPSYVTITGGTFGEDPGEYLAEGYTAIHNETEGVWTVVPSNNE